ncbi:uncharacterized protein O3Q21_001319 [Podargus strigoides]
MEVDRLEELKLRNMKSVIQAIRAELAGFWDKCFYSQEQREAFGPYNDGGCWLFLTALQELQAACPASSQGGLPSAAEAWVSLRGRSSPDKRLFQAASEAWWRRRLCGSSRVRHWEVVVRNPGVFQHFILCVAAALHLPEKHLAQNQGLCPRSLLRKP